MSIATAVSFGFLLGAGAAIAAGFRWGNPPPPRPVTLATMFGKPKRIIWDGGGVFDPREVLFDTAHSSASAGGAQRRMVG